MRSNGWGRTQARWCRSVSWRELTGDEGTGHDEAPEAWGIARPCSGWFGGLDHGHKAGTGTPEGADHGEAG
jgi:hypothetical protein